MISLPKESWEAIGGHYRRRDIEVVMRALGSLGYQTPRPILVTGCFDLLHAGHIDLIHTARARWRFGPLVVAINSDQSIRRLKGAKRPLVPLQDRMAVLASLRVVDLVLWFGGSTAAEVIRYLKPQVWVKGGDYTVNSLSRYERSACNAVECIIDIIPRTHKSSTTGILARI